MIVTLFATRRLANCMIVTLFATRNPSSNLSETNSENKAESLVPCSSLGLPSKNVRIKMYIRFSFSFLYVL
jgi:hypothetical protein